MWDLEKFAVVKTFFKELAAKTKISADKDHSVLFVANEQGEVYRMQTGNKTFDVKYKKFHEDKIRTLEALGPNTFFSGADDGRLKISNFNTGVATMDRSVKQIFHPYYFLYLMVSKNYHRDVLRSTEYSLLKNNIIGVKTLWQPNPFGTSMFKWKFRSFDTTGKEITGNGGLTRWSLRRDFIIPKRNATADTSNAEYLHQFAKTHHTIVGDTTEGFIFSICNDGLIYTWDASSGKLLARILLEKDNKIIFLPDQYYMSSAQSLKTIGYRSGMKFYSPEQFDLKFNRPDIVLNRLGSKDTLLIASYYNAYKKRLKRMNFTEEMLKEDFQLPEIKIKNFETLPLITDSASINLNFEMNDDKYKLDRINIWINDVPVAGTAGIDLRKENAGMVEKKISLELASGRNKIQVSVLNQAGIESYKQSVYITYRPKATRKPDLYLVTIGDSKYSDSRYDLHYAAKDAADIQTTFSANKNKLYENVFAFTFTDTAVTCQNIAGLKEKLAKAHRDDVVLITVAGHGVLDKEYNYYLATYNMDFNDPRKGGLLYEDLEHLLDGIAPLKKILLLDACHSGEVDKEEVQQMAVVNSAGTGDIKFRSAGPGIRKKNLGLKSTSELMAEIFSDLRRGTGATVISSAGGAEYAMESAKWKNGLFTYCLLHGLKDKTADLNNDGKVMLSELQQYLREEVTQLSNGQQQPGSRIQNISMDFRIW
jgi:hypothetical protein